MAKKKNVFENVRFRTIVLWHRTKDKFYYLKCLLWKRYNRIHIKTLPPTWVDRTDVLPHVMFQVLSDFVEREADGVVDWTTTEEHYSARRKMQELYEWWHQVYLKFDCLEGLDRSQCPEDIIDEHGAFQSNEYTRTFYAEANRKEMEIERELNKKCHELIEIRQFLWT